MEWFCRHCQMAQLVDEEMKFELGWNSKSTTSSIRNRVDTEDKTFFAPKPVIISINDHFLG